MLERTRQAMVEANANLGGFFTTTRASEELFVEGHAAMADMLNAASDSEVVFGANMTTLTLHISRSIARMLQPGDEIIVSRMDHDANIAPWLLLAEDRDLTVKWLDFDLGSYQFADDAIDPLLSGRTRLLALGYASNCTGTINDVKAIGAKAKAAGAMVYVDAVQYAPHGPIDVQDLGCDFLACSPYKFFGPHQGVLWGREDLLNEMFAYKVRPASSALPDKFETGTPSFEAIAGTLGAVEYFEEIGRPMRATIWRNMAICRTAPPMCTRLSTISAPTNSTSPGRLVTGLEALPGVTIHGITNANRVSHAGADGFDQCRRPSPRTACQGNGGTEHLRVERPQLCARTGAQARPAGQGRGLEDRPCALQYRAGNRYLPGGIGEMHFACLISTRRANSLTAVFPHSESAFNSLS